ncbi:MAG: ATP-dependent DNA helicase RecG [Gammaproteobacteria bacterium]|nr:ATP-dependent DNA helicase RecG [Gammaproteobacteria bacterium]
MQLSIGRRADCVLVATSSRQGAGSSDLTSLRGVGPGLLRRLEKLDILKVEDLLFHLPMRYEDRTRVLPMGSLVPGKRAVIEGEIQLTEVSFRGRRMLLTSIADGTGSVTLRFFHFSRAQQEGLKRGRRLRCYGEIRAGRGGLEIVHPEYRLLKDDDAAQVEETLTPVYPATEGLQQARLRNLTDQALARLASDGVSEWLPAEVLARLKLPSLAEALAYVHRPPPDARLDLLEERRHPSQRRLAFEELLAHHLSLRRLRERMRKDAACPVSGHRHLLEKFTEALPFSLTAAQQRVVADIRADLAREHPMMRLVQGDVGSGKTVVAALAALAVVGSGGQVGIMAPTELLAEQHLKSFCQWLEPLGLNVVLLTGRLPAAARRTALSAIADGTADVVVGTHALFQESVAFANLALVIVDEQHRFGVHQRLALREKGRSGEVFPHQLVMTATPIPRTLAMTAYADLDVSIIDELPPGRTPVTTATIPESRRAELVARVQEACANGQQAYWVCPLIEESEVLEAQAAEEAYAMLEAALEGLRVGLVHGRMKPAERDLVMQAFKRGEVNLLVATTVIEVGVDVPNAALMVIENAERMGLAQLHQLRGRVGRGHAASSCVLIYRSPLSRAARHRLKVMRETNDGFVIAEEDLKLRGAGEVLGTRQTGIMQMRVADLVRDADLLGGIQEAARIIFRQYPAQVTPLVNRWIGQGSRYGRV